MRILPLTILATLLSCCGLKTQQETPPACYQANPGKSPKLDDYNELVWEDDFNAGKLDESKWVFEDELLYNGYDEQQNFTTRGENISIKNGILRILAIERDSAGEKTYTSARLSTVDKLGYGRLDIHAKMPFGRGVLTTFNLVDPNNSKEEMIDIVNFIGIDSREATGTLRYLDKDNNRRRESDYYFLDDGHGYSRGYHTFSLIREKNACWWYVDGEPFFQVDSTTTLPNAYPFNKELYFTINLSVGGNWAGIPNELTYFPQAVEIDHVKFYAKSNEKKDFSKTNINLPDPAKYSKLVWSDEFEKNTVDTSTWTPEKGDFWHNNEIQAYTGDSTNFFIENGKLILAAIETPSHVKSVRDYTSARLITRGKKDFTFGRIDIRAKMPYGQGIWPAIWMMPTEDKYGAWPRSGEIDILEVIGHEMNIVHNACHFGSVCKRHSRGKTYDSKEDLSKDFHTYSIIKEKDHVWWFYDGKCLTHISKELIAPHHYPFNEKFYLIINIAVGGGWPGYPDETTVFPQKMVVDYVRWYQKEE